MVRYCRVKLRVPGVPTNFGGWLGGDKVLGKLPVLGVFVIWLLLRRSPQGMN